MTDTDTNRQALADWRNADTSGYMTVFDLVHQLAEYPPNAVVVLAKDPEGNGFSPLSSLAAAWYVPESAYAGDVEEIGPRKGVESYKPLAADRYAVILDPIN